MKLIDNYRLQKLEDTTNGIELMAKLLTGLVEEIKEGTDVSSKDVSHDSWIPVSERLPEDLQTVNIVWVNRKPASYYADIKDKPLTATGLIYKGDWYWWSQYTEALLSEYGHDDSDKVDKNIDVIAWKPIEPYTGGEEQCLSRYIRQCKATNLK